MSLRKLAPLAFVVGMACTSGSVNDSDSVAQGRATNAGTYDGIADSLPPAQFVNRPARTLDQDDLEVEVLSPADLDDIEGQMTKEEFDLGRPDDLPRLREAIGRLLELGENQKTSKDSHPERYLPFRFDVSSNGKRRALGETLALLDTLVASGGADSVRILQLLELVHAVQNSFRYPIKKNYQVIPEIFPGLLLRIARHHSVQAGPAVPPVADPPPTSFWRNPGEVGSLDLYAGFRRTAVPRFEDAVCEYRGPKTGWGAHPGFDVRCGEADLTFKLGNERYGGPFNSRIFDALGYHTAPVDPAEGLRLRYDRRVLMQYNSRKLLTHRAKLLFISLKTHTITDIEDPFDRIEYAVMRDGRRVSGDELKAKLLRDHRLIEDRPRPETVAANYNGDFERDIDHLVWEAGTVEPETDDLQSIGAWDFEQLDHAARREVRALFVLAAWVDQWNLRWENTRLAYLKTGGDWSLVHLMSDVGSGLGIARNLRLAVNSDIDTMLWEVTERKDDGTVRFSGFASLEENDAFSSMSADDARWLLRRMGLITERQILSALLATGMSAAEVRLALEKLLSKRRSMIEHFDLAGEFPEIVARPIDRQLDFDPRDPAQLAQVSIQTSTGPMIPRAGDWLVRAGRLERVR